MIDEEWSSMIQTTLDDQLFESKTHQEPTEIQDHGHGDETFTLEHFLKPAQVCFDKEIQLKSERNKAENIESKQNIDT